MITKAVIEASEYGGGIKGGLVGGVRDGQRI